MVATDRRCRARIGLPVGPKASRLVVAEQHGLTRFQIIGVEYNTNVAVTDPRVVVEDVRNGRKIRRGARRHIELRRQKSVKYHLQRMSLWGWRREPSADRFQVGRPKDSGIAGE